MSSHRILVLLAALLLNACSGSISNVPVHSVAPKYKALVATGVNLGDFSDVRGVDPMLIVEDASLAAKSFLSFNVAAHPNVLSLVRAQFAADLKHAGMKIAPTGEFSVTGKLKQFMIKIGDSGFGSCTIEVDVRIQRGTNDFLNELALVEFEEEISPGRFSNLSEHESVAVQCLRKLYPPLLEKWAIKLRPKFSVD